MAQCQYLTYVGNRTHCIDTCNYIVQYPNMTEEFCLAKCDGFAFSMNYSLPQCADKSCLLPRCVDKCPIGYYAEGGNCTLIRASSRKATSAWTRARRATFSISTR